MMNGQQGFRKNNNFEVALDKLDKSQLAAVLCEQDNIVIRAGAGSGKTNTLITAIANYRYENLNDRICAITYTRAARAEMEERLRSMGVYDIEVTTIHVWARNLLNDLADKYHFFVKILEEPQIKSILSEIVRNYLLRSKIKSVNINILYTYITGSKTMDITDNYRRTLNALEERYINYKRENGLYDFTDYPLYLYDVLKTYNEYITNIDALFVDEFQDVDSNQFETFQRVICRKKFFIGDSWQSIFVFRGADGEVFNKLEGFTLFKLKYNYRSYQEIIDYATTVYLNLRETAEIEDDCYITQIDWTEPSSINCERGYGGKVRIINPRGKSYYFHNQKQYDEEADVQLKTMIDSNPIILCRTNKQVRAVQELGFINSTTIHQAKGLEYDNVIVIDSTISSLEDLNIAYVGMTRAKNELLVINWSQFINWLEAKTYGVD